MEESLLNLYKIEYWKGIKNIGWVLEMYLGYRKFKIVNRAEHWVIIGYQKYRMGIGNIEKV